MLCIVDCASFLVFGACCLLCLCVGACWVSLPVDVRCLMLVSIVRCVLFLVRCLLLNANCMLFVAFRSLHLFAV